MHILISSIVSVVAALLGALVGGWVGHKASLIQWEASLKEERRREMSQKVESLITLTYELCDHVYAYSINSEYAPNLIAFSSKNPLPRIVSLCVHSFPEIGDDLERLQEAILHLHKLPLPVPRMEMDKAIESCNEFGEAILAKVGLNEIELAD
ncbi:MAG: hypothetical protein KDA93_05645 [Planctomycetaceae bacterium]|nr:hypothetical protein [Planctomycetaceae bacterium]